MILNYRLRSPIVWTSALVCFAGASPAEAAPQNGSLDASTIPKYEMPLIVPPAMPTTDERMTRGGKRADYYEIAVRQFEQQVLPPVPPIGGPDPNPPPLAKTTVWSYGSVNHPETFNYPAYTIEARFNRPVRVKWINELVDEQGNYLPHLFAVDQTVHWANPPGDCEDPELSSDCRGTEQTPYTGPVPFVTHLHGGHSPQQYDGYPEAWVLPAAANISEFHPQGRRYSYFRELAMADGIAWEPGSMTFEYPNDQPAATLWYHDHALGITRLNVYAGPAGFYLIRGGPNDLSPGRMPGPPRGPKDLPDARFYEVPIVIQDRSFNSDGSLFYPDNRAFFEGLDPDQLQITFRPDIAESGEASDVSKIINPEFFGAAMVVNGRTWPFFNVEPRRYRLRLLNGSQSRFLILDLDPCDSIDDGDLPFWQIGGDGGFLPAPVRQDQLLLAPAERADVIVDFTKCSFGSTMIMRNLGPDEPFGGGVPGVDFDSADPETTGQVMQFHVVELSPGMPDLSDDPETELSLPDPGTLPQSMATKQFTLNELDSSSVFVVEDADGNIVEDEQSDTPFGPVETLLGVLGVGALPWAADITASENPQEDMTETWEFHNLTADAHPIHVHQVQFEVLEREDMLTGVTRGPEPGELGFKDTVIAYPGEITRIRARFDLFGLFVWHCHILEHEDNEMMRPFHVGPIPPALQ